MDINDIPDEFFGNPVQSTEMARIKSKDIPKRVPPNMMKRIIASGNINMVDGFYNDNEEVKLSKYCIFEAGISGHLGFTFGFIRAGVTKGSKGHVGFNDPDPKFVFCVLQVRVGDHHNPVKFLEGKNFDDKEFEPIWEKLCSNEMDNITTSNWLGKNYFGNLLGAKLLVTDQVQPITGILYDLVSKR